jgi:hypothetical protein
MIYVNFSYSSPNNDIEECTGLNFDGSININYTLKSMRNKLMENVDLLNKLIENYSKSISGIYAAGYNDVAISVDSKKAIDEMLKLKLIRTTKSEFDDIDNAFGLSDRSSDSESDEETHTSRLRMINNLVRTGESQNINSNSDSESESSDYIEDAENMMSILCKYNDLINKNGDNDNHGNHSDD